MDIEHIQGLFVRAMADDTGFTRHGSRMGTWDISRGCESPVPVTLYSRQTGKAKALRTGKIPPGIELVLVTPCRRCRTCLKRHARLWRERAVHEIENSDRTWFGTLTLSPEEHTRVDHLCATAIGRNFWNLPPGKKFAARKKVIGREITLYLKRVRKESGVPFRYLCVFETHDGEDTSDFMRGRPHVHFLLHEFAGPVRKRTLDAQWKLGFTNWRLATTTWQAAWYVAKYISKAVDARVRASLRYGNSSQSLIED